MAMSNRKPRLVLVAALVLSAGLGAGCVSHYHDPGGYGYRQDGYYGGYGRGTATATATAILVTIPATAAAPAGWIADRTASGTR